MNEHTNNQVGSTDDTDPQSTAQVTTTDSNENSSSLGKTIIEDKPAALNKYFTTECDEKPSLLEVLRHNVKSFNGNDDARQWLQHIQLFVQELIYVKLSPDLDVNDNREQTNKYFLLRPPDLTNEFTHDYGLGFKKDKSSSIQLIGAVVTRSKSITTSQHITSSSPSQHTPSSLTPPSNDFNYSYPDEKSFDILKLKENQFNDKQVQKVINDLKENPNMSFVYQDGILYKLASIPHGKTKRKLFYIPSSMIKHLLISYHNNSLIGGHFAIRRTLEKLKQQLWWPIRPLSLPNN